MKTIVRRTALAVCTLVLSLILPTAASAACAGFDDVPESADCYESVIYLAECEIAAGTGNDCFSPEQLITVEQWAVMLCRAYGAETIGDSWQDVGRSSVVEAYRQGWLNETALSTPNIQLCRGALLKSAFAAAKIPVYDSVLYAGGVSLPDHENCIRIGKELQLCGEANTANEIVTRRDAAMLLHAILTRAFTVEAPPAPVALVKFGRVAVGDDVAALLNARLVVVLVGERPGLSSPDSLGVYMTHAPTPGLTDEARNCISNVRAAGLPVEEAVRKLCYLVENALVRRLSGVDLNDDVTPGYLPFAETRALG
mgnify:CR=1 FL=1